MKSVPVFSTTRTGRTETEEVKREGDKENGAGTGGGLVTSGKDMTLSERRGGGGGGGGVAKSTSSALNSTVTSVSSHHHPTWMRKLEVRYQRLHKKILTIPHYQSAASRFNFLTRRFINDALAKAKANQQQQQEQDSNNNNAGDISSRKSSTVPHSLLTEELISQPPDDDDDTSDEDNGRDDATDNQQDKPYTESAVVPTACESCARCGASVAGLYGESDRGVDRSHVSSCRHCPQHPQHPRRTSLVPPATPFTLSCNQCMHFSAHLPTAEEVSRIMNCNHYHHHQHHHQLHSAKLSSAGGPCGCCVSGRKGPSTASARGNATNALPVTNLNHAAQIESRHYSLAERVEQAPEGNNNSDPYPTATTTIITALTTHGTDNNRGVANTELDLAESGGLADNARHGQHPHHHHHDNPQPYCYQHGHTKQACPQLNGEESSQQERRARAALQQRRPSLTVSNVLLKNYDGVECSCSRMCPVCEVSMVSAVGVTDTLSKRQTSGVGVLQSANRHGLVTRGNRGGEGGGEAVHGGSGGGSTQALRQAPPAGWLSGHNMGDMSTTPTTITKAVPTFHSNGHSHNKHASGGAVVNGSRHHLVTHKNSVTSHYSNLTHKASPTALGSPRLFNNTSARSKRGTVANRVGTSSGRGGRQKMKVFERMSLEARHAITETLKEMDAGDDQKDDDDDANKEDDKAYEYSDDLESVDELDIDDRGDADKADITDDNVTSLANGFPTPREKAPSSPPLPEPKRRRGGKRRQRQNVNNKNNDSTHLQPPTKQHQQGSRESSLSISHKTVSNRTPVSKQKSFRTTATRDTDVNTSSVAATVRGGKSPRRSVSKKPPSTVVTSVHAARSRMRSGKTVATSVAAGVGASSELTRKNNHNRHHHQQHQIHRHNNKNRNLPYDDDFDIDGLTLHSEPGSSSGLSSPGWGEEAEDGGETKMEGPGGRFSVPHLPAITTSRTDPQQHMVSSSLRHDNMRHFNYRIRGVGSYRVARETTFEITAPDYDIRYRDVISCQKGDRDTPPLDIYEKSVGKVRDWLNKHYNNSPPNS